jgi:hypothetical protein
MNPTGMFMTLAPQYCEQVVSGEYPNPYDSDPGPYLGDMLQACCPAYISISGIISGGGTVMGVGGKPSGNVPTKTPEKGLKKGIKKRSINEQVERMKKLAGLKKKK